ncbi:MAG: hypothetical protein ACI9A2_002477 [Halioglobus sp.]
MIKLTALLFALSALPLGAEEYSPPLNEANKTNVYWGDLHVHSNYSPDSFAFGNSRLSPEDSMKFAKGVKVTANNGMDVQLRRPLDFLLVADHAEFIGVFPMLLNDDPVLLETDLGKEWRNVLDNAGGDIGAIINEWLARMANTAYEQELSEDFRLNVWKEAAGFAENQNDPGVFTAFVGYEWTSMVEGNNLHRVVLFRDGAEKATQLPPYSALDSVNPEQLWAAMQRYETKTGGQVMSIPHNGNISNGLMFALEDLDGKPLDRDYAERRARWEPVYEVTQVKGDGEAHPFLSPDDEFADFETWDQDNIGRTVAKTDSMLKHEYARSALKLGLELENKLGANPYQFGMIGATDSHTTLSTADDNNFWGKFLDSEPSAERMESRMGGSLWKNWRLAASGYAGVWARENTREALFDALQRKEVYATTGPRIALRLFAGWDFVESDIASSNLADIGYTKGVPMGGQLSQGPHNGSPKFLIQAFKDPDGANLDRVQIIKGWLNGKGESQEQVFDVALSDDRTVDANTGKAPSVASTVDVEQASYTNSVGAVSFGVFWEDPDFDAKQRAFYYARVIEIPTPRWTAYDAKYFEVDPPENTPMVTQERVYSSPIWYDPTQK